MKKRTLKFTIGAMLCGSVLFTSCIGSFGLTGKLYSWNKKQTKWVDELIFLALCIVPVYEVSLFIDAIILNSIEFWTGSNPVAFQPGESRTVETEAGVYVVTAHEQGNGYTVVKEGEEGSLDLTYDKENNVCYMDKGDGEKIRIK